MNAPAPLTITPETHGALVEFFTTLYGTDSGGYLMIGTVTPGRTSFDVHWHQAADPDGAADLALSLAAGANVYFGVGLHPEPLSGNRRGTADRVVTLPGLWADVDIAHDVHKKAKHLPPTVEAAQELVMSMGPKPSIVVHTGHGLQAYWLFDGPVTFTSPEHRDEFKNLSERWGETLKSRAAERRWKVDSTFDISRVLRVPYTVNRKAEPVPVRIMEVR